MPKPETFITMRFQTDTKLTLKPRFHEGTLPHHSQAMIRVFHPRRSGGHPVISWILDAFDAPRVWANNLPLGLTKPRTTLFEGEGTTHKTATVLAFEDPNRTLPLIQARSKMGLASHLYGTADRSDYVCVMRDAYNHVASRMGSKDEPSCGWHGVKDVEAWKECARWCLAYKSNWVFFDHWLVSEHYRHTVATALRLPKTTHAPPDKPCSRSSFSQGDPLARGGDVELPAFVLQDKELSRLNKELWESAAGNKGV